MTCPDCGTRAHRVGPFVLCRNVECDRLVVRGRLLTTPWARRALGRDVMLELEAAMPPDMALHVGAVNMGRWGATVVTIPARYPVGRSFDHPTAAAAGWAGVELARKAKKAAA